MANNSTVDLGLDDIPFYRHPIIVNGVPLIKTLILSMGILANLGVVLTVAFHNCPRKHAAFAAASLSVSNIFYALFILFYATPLRFSPQFQHAVMTTRFFCHVTQVGSNAPKTWIVGHHVWIAIDTFWLIKKPFQYSTLIAKYFRAAFIFLWVGLTIFEIIFQTLTLCFYETFYHEIYNLTNPPTCIIPEIANIIISFTMYISAFVLVVFLYYYVFQEALKRARGAKLTSTNAEPKIERESLTGSTTNDENDQEAYKRELRLLYGFVALITGTIFFIIARNFYYGLCLYIGCENRAQNDYLVSTLTSIMICSTVVFAPYTYFYRNPLFWKCFLKFVLKVCPKLANYSEQLRQQTAGYYNNNLPQNKTRQVNNNNNTNANTITKATCLVNKQNNNGKACEENNIQVNNNHEIVELKDEINRETCA